ncbi:TPA: hypothetical protein ACVOYM_005159 [Vibrio diabolicus]
MHKISSVKGKPVEMLRILALAQFGAKAFCRGNNRAELFYWLMS